MNAMRGGGAGLLAAAAVIALMGCGGDGGGAGGGVVSDACVADDTATMRFVNESSAEGYDVLLDGAIVGSIGASLSFTRVVPAGTHAVGWRFAGTTATACPSQTSEVVACDAKVYTCAAVDLLRCLHRNYGTALAQNTHNFPVTVTIDARPYVLETFGSVSVNLEAGLAHEISFSGPDGVLCNPVSFILEPCQERIFRC